MSLIKIFKKLKKMTPVLTVGMTLMAPTLKAQSQETPERTPMPMVEKSEMKWQWFDSASQALYDSLPDEYKKFANKTFDERMMMREEWEQRDYLRRLKQYNNILKKKPWATLADLDPDSPLANKSLSDFKVANFLYQEHIVKEQLNGNLSADQAKLAFEMIYLGRPLATIDTKLPYYEQLKLCGFDIMANLVLGEKKENLSNREKALFCVQDQESELLQTIGQNKDFYREFCRRLYKEDWDYFQSKQTLLDKIFGQKVRLLKEGEYIPTPQEKINGKTVFIPKKGDVKYSYYDELVRRVADNLKKEDLQQSETRKNLLSKER